MIPTGFYYGRPLSGGFFPGTGDGWLGLPSAVCDRGHMRSPFAIGLSRVAKLYLLIVRKKKMKMESKYHIITTIAYSTSFLERSYS